jgi:hypothetical protein
MKMTNPKPREAEEFDLEDAALDHSMQEEWNSSYSFECGFRKAVEVAREWRLRNRSYSAESLVNYLKKLAGVK